MSGDYSSYKQAKATSGKNTSKSRKKSTKKPNTIEQKEYASRRTTARGDLSRSQPIAKKKANRKETIKNKKLLKERDKQNKRLQRMNRKNRRKSFYKKVKPVQITLFILGVYLVLAANLVVNNNSQLALLKYKVTELNTEITRQENIINELEAKRESTFKSQTIENYAKYKLDMVYPTKEQTVYIKVG